MEPPLKLRLGNPPRIASPWADRAESGLVLQALTPAGGHSDPYKSPLVILTGRAGSGKTQIAAAVYYGLSSEVDLSLWISARSLDEIVAAYAEAERFLATPGLRTENSTGGTEDLTREAISFLQRLEDKTILRSWLVVLDDLAISDNAMGAWWPPSTDHGRTLITSQSYIHSTGHVQTKIVPVGTLSIGETTSLLRSAVASKLTAHSAGTLAGLAEQSQGLPLAVSQIAALLTQSSLSADEVLHELVESERRAQTFLLAGRLREAEHQLVILLEAQEQALPPDDPSILATRANLASVFAKSGRLSEALDALRSVVADQERVLGPDHPTTLITRANLAQLHGQTGDIAYAINELRSLVADQERVLGPDHYTTLNTREDLAFWLGEAGEPVAALAALEDVVAWRDRSRRWPGDAHAPRERLR